MGKGPDLDMDHMHQGGKKCRTTTGDKSIVFNFENKIDRHLLSQIEEEDQKRFLEWLFTKELSSDGLTEIKCLAFQIT